MSKRKLKFDKDKILGVLSFVFLVIEIIGIYLVSQLGSYGTVFDYIFLAIFGYTIYKTLIKKQKLKKLEFYLVIIAIIIFILGALVGFLLPYTF